MSFDIVLFLDCSIISNHLYYFDDANNLNDIIFFKMEKLNDVFIIFFNTFHNFFQFILIIT